MKIHIDKLLKEKGKTRYWLANETGIYYHNLVKLCDGKTSSIGFELMEKICIALECNLQDIFEIEKEGR